MQRTAVHSIHTYEVRPRKDHRGFDLISDRLPFGRLWYVEAADAVDYAKFYSRSHQAIIRVFDARYLLDSGQENFLHARLGLTLPLCSKQRNSSTRNSC